MACDNQLATGRTLIVSYATEDCEQDPAAINSWRPIGLVDNASETFTPRTTTANVDTETTTLTEYTGADASLSVSGLDAPDEVALQNQQALRSFQRTNAMARPPRTPKLWVRVEDTFIGENRFYYMTLGDTERSGEVEGNRTYSFNFTMVPTGVSTNSEYQRQDRP